MRSSGASPGRRRRPPEPAHRAGRAAPPGPAPPQGSRASRRRLVQQEHVALNAEQIGLIERVEPGFRDRAAPAGRPGEQLLQAAFYFGRVQGRRAYVHCVLDAFSSVAFACVASGRRRAAVAASLLEECVSGLRQRGLHPRTVFTSDSRSFRGVSARAYQRALRRCRVAHDLAPQVRGQVERFRRRLLGELLSEHHHLHLDETWTRFANAWALVSNLQLRAARRPSQLHGALPWSGCTASLWRVRFDAAQRRAPINSVQRDTQLPAEPAARR
jgi:hypothetical protein